MARKLLKLTAHDQSTRWGDEPREVPFFISTYAITAFIGTYKSGMTHRVDGDGNPVFDKGEQVKDPWTVSGTDIFFADEHGNKHSQFVTEDAYALAAMIEEAENG